MNESVRRTQMLKLWDIYHKMTHTRYAFIEQAMKLYPLMDREELKAIWYAFDTAQGMCDIQGGNETGEKGVTYTSKEQLAEAMRVAADNHHTYEVAQGKRDKDWPAWYAEYMIEHQGGKDS